jgi:hypothetical protein
MERSANTSYFLSWGWIENWITSLPDHAKPALAVFQDGDDPHVAFFLGKANLTRKGFLRSRGWFVNATGIPAFDRLYIEYNGILCDNPDSFRFVDLVRSLPGDWDELYLPGLDARAFPGMAALDRILPHRTLVEDDLLSPFVDLDLVRTRGDYLPLLSANARAQLRRAYRLFENEAPIRIESARNLQSALNTFDALVVLHESTWEKRGKAGAFSNQYLLQFHKRLIEKRYDHDEIQLLSIKYGDKILGYLYNYVYRSHVYFYQSGINYAMDKRLKPGLVTHVEAIKYCASAGHKTYDFLAGDSRYKMSLATHQNRLLWVRLQKPLVRFALENAIKKFRRLLIKRNPT